MGLVSVQCWEIMMGGGASQFDSMADMLACVQNLPSPRNQMPTPPRPVLFLPTQMFHLSGVWVQQRA